MIQFRSFDDNGNLIYGGRADKGTRGMVSSGRAEASWIGKEIMAAGGNAVDAAVAVAFALGVCEPNASGLGGGGFMLLRNGRTGKTDFLDFRERAPMASDPSMYEPGGPYPNCDKYMRNVFGGTSAAVPGEVAGLLYALENYGTMDRKTVMAPAIKLAKEGYLMTPLLSGDINSVRAQMEKHGNGWEIYGRDGEPPKAGTMMTNPELAKTLELIAEGGTEVFYRGEIAEKIVRKVSEDGGRMTAEDLKAFRVRVKEPVRGSYRGYEIISSPTPSSGGTHVIQILNVLENFDVGAMEINSPEYIHLFSETFKMCYADRLRYMGDPDFVKLPLKGLMSKEYAKTLAARIDPERSHAPECGDPWAAESMSTTHFSIADSEGNLAAVTRTVNHYFGSCAVPEGTGFFLNDQMADFSIDPESPNAPAGGKIPLSSMSPTFILKDGKPVAVVGSPGGTRIISSVVQIISKLIDHGLDLESAVNSPRFGDDTADCIIYESRIPKETIEALEAMGHKTKAYPQWHRIMGSLNSVMLLPDGSFEGAADPRRDGKAVGY